MSASPPPKGKVVLCPTLPSRWFDLLAPSRLKIFQATNMSSTELAVVYATLILTDDGVEVTVRCLQGEDADGLYAPHARENGLYV